MDALKSGLSNSTTTIIGIIVGILTYLEGVGPNLPQDAAGWLHFAVALGLAALGVVAKDATRGSQPPSV